MSLRLSIKTVLIEIHGQFQKIILFRLAYPVIHPLDPGCHFDIMCECKKTHILTKGHAGSSGKTPRHIVDWDVKPQNKQTNKHLEINIRLYIKDFMY